MFADHVESAAEFLDFVKFGWDPVIVTDRISDQIETLESAGIDYYFGSTFFEKYVSQDRFDDSRELCHRYGCRYVEVSHGTIDLSNTEKAVSARQLSPPPS